MGLRSGRKTIIYIIKRVYEPDKKMLKRPDLSYTTLSGSVIVRFRGFSSMRWDLTKFPKLCSQICKDDFQFSFNIFLKFSFSYIFFFKFVLVLFWAMAMKTTVLYQVVIEEVLLKPSIEGSTRNPQEIDSTEGFPGVRL